MEAFILCFLRIVLYTLGVVIACGLAVEICYQLCFLLMGQKVGRRFWLVTSFLGTPVHELGHALMCLLFAHRIENIRLIPTRAGGPVVEHSYNKRNPYAVFGNLWIGLGPMLLGIALTLAVLQWVYPASMQSYRAVLGTLPDAGAPNEPQTEAVGQFLRGLLTEQTRAWWVRLLAAVALFSMALHIRLSASDVLGMLRGLPAYAVIAAVVALVATWMGEDAVNALTLKLHQGAWLLASLFSLILLSGLAQLALVLLYRLLLALFRAWRSIRSYEPDDDYDEDE